MKKGGFRRLSDCQKTFQSKDYGKEDRVKDDARRLIQRATDAKRRHLARGNPSGVSFAFNQPVFQTFLKFEKLPSVTKRLFDTLGVRSHDGFGRFLQSQRMGATK